MMPVKIMADGDIIVNRSDLKIIKDSFESFEITLNNAAGRLNIMTDDKDIANVNIDSVFLDKNSNIINVIGNKTGSTKIRVYAYDVSTYDLELLDGKTFDINVNVYDRGDTNYNNKIDMEDITTVLRQYVGINDVTNMNMVDINNDGIFNINDIVQLLKDYLGID